MFKRNETRFYVYFSTCYKTLAWNGWMATNEYSCGHQLKWRPRTFSVLFCFSYMELLTFGFCLRKFDSRCEFVMYEALEYLPKLLLICDYDAKQIRPDLQLYQSSEGAIVSKKRNKQFNLAFDRYRKLYSIESVMKKMRPSQTTWSLITSRVIYSTLMYQ